MEKEKSLAPGMLVVDVEGLSPLLKRAPKTIKVDMSRRPLSVPPAVHIPGSRSPLWIVSDVLAWMKRHQAVEGEKQPQPQQFRKARGLQSPAKKGAPSKAERVEAARQKVSVTEDRKRAANKLNQSAPASA